jgi:hypothetical protein
MAGFEGEKGLRVTAERRTALQAVDVLNIVLMVIRHPKQAELHRVDGLVIVHRPESQLWQAQAQPNASQQRQCGNEPPIHKARGPHASISM